MLLVDAAMCCVVAVFVARSWAQTCSSYCQMEAISKVAAECWKEVHEVDELMDEWTRCCHECIHASLALLYKLQPDPIDKYSPKLMLKIHPFRRNTRNRVALHA